MKKFVKLYEDFNPGDFLEDMDVPVFSFTRLVKAIESSGHNDTTIMKLISTGMPFEEYENTRTYLTVTNKSKYYLDFSAKSFPYIQNLINSKEDSYLDIYWEIIFLHEYERADDDSGNFEHSIYVEIEARCTHPKNKFYKSYHSQFPIERSKTLDHAIKKQIISLNELFTFNEYYEVRNAVFGHSLAQEVNKYFKELEEK